MKHYSLLSSLISISKVNCKIFCIISNLVFGNILFNLHPNKAKKESTSSGSGGGGKTTRLFSLHIASAILSIAFVESLVFLFFFFPSLEPRIYKSSYILIIFQNDF